MQVKSYPGQSLPWYPQSDFYGEMVYVAYTTYVAEKTFLRIFSTVVPAHCAGFLRICFSS